MDGFEINKVMGAVTGTLAVFLGINIIADGVFDHGGHGKDEKLAYAVAGVSAGGPDDGKEEPTFEELLAAATPEQGAKAFKACGACHSAEKGAGAKVGPGLYGVVGRPIASADGFGYKGLAAKASEGDWGFANLDAFLENPTGWAPGSAMNLKTRNPEKRAAIIVYLNSQSDSPLALPAAAAAPAAPSE